MYPGHETDHDAANKKMRDYQIQREKEYNLRAGVREGESFSIWTWITGKLYSTPSDLDIKDTKQEIISALENLPGLNIQCIQTNHAPKGFGSHLSPLSLAYNPIPIHRQKIDVLNSEVGRKPNDCMYRGVGKWNRYLILAHELNNDNPLPLVGVIGGSGDRMRSGCTLINQSKDLFYHLIPGTLIKAWQPINSIATIVQQFDLSNRIEDPQNQVKIKHDYPPGHWVVVMAPDNDFTPDEDTNDWAASEAKTGGYILAARATWIPEL